MLGEINYKIGSANANAKKAIVFASSHYNSQVKVGSHHYADALSYLGYEVLYISFPVNIFHYIAAIFSRRQRERVCSRKGVINNVQFYIPFSLIPVNGPFPFNTRLFCRNWVIFSGIKRRVNAFQGAQRCDLVWSESAFFVKLIKNLIETKKPRKCLFRLSDNVVRFKNFPNSYKYILNENFSLADTIVISAASLKEVINKDYLSKICHWPNGINLGKISVYSREQPDEYVGNLRRKILYIGAIEYWFDWGIVDTISSCIDDCDTFLIGPYENGIIPNWVKLRKNVHLLGSRPHDQIGKYISNSDVGIIPFKRDDMIDYVDPIKYYEYSYFGLPTVCSYWKEVACIQSVIYLAKTPAEFAQKIKEILNTIPNNRLKDFGINFNRRNWISNIGEII